MRPLLLILLFLPTFATGQSKSPVYKNTIKVADSLSKETLFLRAEKWFDENDGFADLHLDSLDKVRGVIFGRANIDCTDTPGRGYCYIKNLRLKVTVKRGIYRYEIKYIGYHHGCGGTSPLQSAEISRLPIIRYGDTTNKTPLIPAKPKAKVPRRPPLTKHKDYSFKECANEIVRSLKKSMIGL